MCLKIVEIGRSRFFSIGFATDAYMPFVSRTSEVASRD